MSKLLGIRCPECASERSLVINSRDNVLGRKRTRKCTACKHKYITWEMTEATVHIYEIKEVYKALLTIETAVNHVKNVIGDFGND